VIIRSQIRDAATDPMNQAAMPTWILSEVQAILAKANQDWSECECGTLMYALDHVACANPNS
jgi:hypothetical protein